MDLSFINKPTNFYKYVAHVVEWNRIACGGKHDFSAQKIAAQKKFVQEEFRELVEDGIQKGNKVEVADALADLVVTVGYWMYLKEPDLIKNSCTLLHYGMGNNYVKLLENDIINDRPWEAFQSVMSLCHQVDFRLHDTIQEVLSSNDTKIPKVSYYKDFAGEDMWEKQLNAEVAFMNKMYEGRYEGIYWQQVGNHIVFRDKNLKIIKPRCFVDVDLTNFV